MEFLNSTEERKFRFRPLIIGHVCEFNVTMNEVFMHSGTLESGRKRRLPVMAGRAR